VDEQQLTKREILQIARGLTSRNTSRVRAASDALLAVSPEEMDRLLADLRPDRRAAVLVSAGFLLAVALSFSLFQRSIGPVTHLGGIVVFVINANYLRHKHNQIAAALEVMVKAQRSAGLKDCILALQSSRDGAVKVIMPVVTNGLKEASDEELILLPLEAKRILAECLEHASSVKSISGFYHNGSAEEAVLCRDLDLAILSRASKLSSERMLTAVSEIAAPYRKPSHRTDAARAVLPQLLEAEERRKSGEGLPRIPRDHGVEPASELLRPNTEAEQQSSGRS
jgi:hypothetical protein